MFMKKFGALMLIFVFYLVAFGSGFVFAYFMEPLLNDTILNLFLATTISTVVIYLSNIIIGNNATVYDPYWSVQPVFLLVTYFILTNSFRPLHLIVLIPLALWAIRLTTNWALGFTDLKWQDWRYTQLKDGQKYRIMKELIVFVGIMYVPTLAVFAGTIPLFVSFSMPGIFQLGFYLIGGAIVLCGTTLQLISDIQMMLFKKRKTGKNIEMGLWKFSRHPNYLGELMIWTGVFIAALNLFVWYNVFGIIIIYAIFIFISIPLAEKRYLKKYPGYADYRQRTSMLLILPPRKIREEGSGVDDQAK